MKITIINQCQEMCYCKKETCCQVEQTSTNRQNRNDTSKAYLRNKSLK